MPSLNISSEDFNAKFIHDNIHGSIGLSYAEYRIVNTQAFQRLRKIKQLGLSNLVFPSADHTRFSHSLGVLRIMGRMTSTLERNNFIKPEDTRKLRMAALLHDIGHYPLSHLVESVYKRKKKQIVHPKRKIKTLGKLSAIMDSKTFESDKKYAHHERLGAKVITERDEIKNILEEEGFDPEEIAKIINGEHKENPIYDQLMHSGLDADRIDYLLRDSSLTGVSYGQIDLDYLLNHLRCSEKTVGIDVKGQHAVEHYLMSRYFMYSQIIYHKTIIGFEAVAKALYDILADEGIVYKNFEEVQKIVNTDKFIDFNDDYFFNKISEGFKKRKELRSVSPEIYEKYYRIIKERIPLKLIREEKILYKDSDHLPKSFTSFITRVQDRLNVLLKRHGKTVDEALFCELDFSVEGLSPYFPITTPDIPDDEMKKDLIKIIKKDGTIVPLIAERNSLIHYISQLRLKIARLYIINTENDEKYIEKISKTVSKW